MVPGSLMAWPSLGLGNSPFSRFVSRDSAVPYRHSWLLEPRSRVRCWLQGLVLRSRYDIGKFQRLRFRMVPIRLMRILGRWGKANLLGFEPMRSRFESEAPFSWLVYTSMHGTPMRRSRLWNGCQRSGPSW
jgi:hypothetical protein